MARTRRRKASARRHTNAGRRRTRRNPARHHRRRSNPGGYRVTDLVVLGGGAVVGASVPKLASQAFLGAKNTGLMGYAANLAGTGILAWAAQKFVKNRSFAMGILAGGIGQVISRAIADYTSVGQLLNGAGLGDYMAANFVTPQILPNALDSAMSSNGFQQPIVMSSSGANGMAGILGPPIW